MLKAYKTGEEMHQHADSLPAHVKELLSHPPTDKAGAMMALCPLYQVSRPFLASLAGMFFVPQKLKDLISGFLSVLDLLCPPLAAEGSPEPEVPLFPAQAKAEAEKHKETKAEAKAHAKEEHETHSHGKHKK